MTELHIIERKTYTKVLGNRFVGRVIEEGQGLHHVYVALSPAPGPKASGGRIFEPCVPIPLDRSKKMILRSVQAKGRSHVSRCHIETVTSQDLARLQPQQWVNDEIINFYGAMIRDANAQSSNDPDTPNQPSLHYFSTFFYTKLQDSGYVGGLLKNWTKKVSIEAVAIRSRD